VSEDERETKVPGDRDSVERAEAIGAWMPGARGWDSRRPRTVRRARPPWWPANEPWPPAGGQWGARRAPFARRFGCFFAVLFFIGLAGLISLVTHVFSGTGPIGEAARVLGLFILVGGVVALTASGRTFRRAAVALDDLVEAAGKVEAGDYAARVDEGRPGPRPVRDLARSFNSMAQRLETNEAQLRTLLADVSHELRTPLTVVQGNLEAILDGVHEADEQHLSAILDETRVLGRLVDDLRTVALSEAGSLPLHREPTDLGILVTDAVGGFRPAADAAGVALSVEVADDVPLLDVDPVRIREVVSNLVANALRHTQRGGSISITASGAGAGVGGAAGVAGAAANVTVTVTDTGTGIDPALLPYVFDRFTKAADSRGSGLGLAIARGLVEAHGGSIAVESSRTGTTFRFTLPI
jgi:signal transduction histidine kinase